GFQFLFFIKISDEPADEAVTVIESRRTERSDRARDQIWLRDGVNGDLRNVLREKSIRITGTGAVEINLAGRQLHGVNHFYQRLHQVLVRVAAPDFCGRETERIKIDHGPDLGEIGRAQAADESLRSHNLIAVVGKGDKDNGVLPPAGAKTFI